MKVQNKVLQNLLANFTSVPKHILLHSCSLPSAGGSRKCLTAVSLFVIVSVNHISCPLLILHAEDDNVVPFHLGKKVKQKQNSNSRTSVSLSSSHSYTSWPPSPRASAVTRFSLFLFLPPWLTGTSSSTGARSC